jgi:hypothetical protein
MTSYDIDLSASNLNFHDLNIVLRLKGVILESVWIICNHCFMKEEKSRSFKKTIALMKE